MSEPDPGPDPHSFTLRRVLEGMAGDVVFVTSFVAQSAVDAGDGMVERGPIDYKPFEVPANDPRRAAFELTFAGITYHVTVEEKAP